MKQYVIATLASVLLIVPVVTQAHHSFAIYDIDNKIERSGVVKKFVFSNPHIKMVLEATLDDGAKETWVIESMNPSRWDRLEIPRDVTAVGETVTLLGWPARDGTDEMALSTIITKRGETVIRDVIRQKRARENLPEKTVKRK